MDSTETVVIPLCWRSPSRSEATSFSNKQSLYLGIENAVAGNHVGDIGFPYRAIVSLTVMALYANWWDTA